MKTIYYVYAYLRTDGTPYYIGKGKNNRAYSKQHNINLPNNNGRIVFLEKNLTEIGALALERRYIKWYGRLDIDTGILENLTDGGEGVSGLLPWNKGKKLEPLTKEHKAKLSFANKGKKYRPRTSEHKIAQSIRLTGKKRGPYGPRLKPSKPRTPEHSAKISAALKGNIPWIRGKKQSTEHITKRMESIKKNRLAKNQAASDSFLK